MSVQPESPEADGRRVVRRALVSVFDKAGLLDLATGLRSAVSGPSVVPGLSGGTLTGFSLLVR